MGWFGLHQLALLVSKGRIKEPLLLWESSTSARFDQTMSAFAGKADINSDSANVCFVPEAVITMPLEQPSKTFEAGFNKIQIRLFRWEQLFYGSTQY